MTINKKKLNAMSDMLGSHVDCGNIEQENEGLLEMETVIGSRGRRL